MRRERLSRSYRELALSRDDRVYTVVAYGPSFADDALATEEDREAIVSLAAVAASVAAARRRTRFLCRAAPTVEAALENARTTLLTAGRRENWTARGYFDLAGLLRAVFEHGAPANFAAIEHEIVEAVGAEMSQRIVGTVAATVREALSPFRR